MEIKNKKPYSKQFDVVVNVSNSEYKDTFQLDKSVIAVTAITLIADKEDLMYYRGSIKLEINKEEIFSEGYSVKRIMCLPTVSPNQRAFKIGEVLAGNGQIKFEYTDAQDGRTVGFTPYKVTLCVDGYTSG
jgi:hypothetical protein